MSLLEVVNLTGGYGRVKVLHGIDFAVEDHEVVVILGANGAGKTTVIRALCGLVKVSGAIRLAGRSLVGMPTERIARLGVAHVPQGRGTFSEFTVEENLRLGGYRHSAGEIRRDMADVYEAFPALEQRGKQMAGSLSGGEQQMLAVARALMLRPTLMLLDEPSLGLAPFVVRDLFQMLARINKRFGTTLLIVEQNANLALQICQRAFILEVGRIVSAGSADTILSDDRLRAAYLGY
jgi:branched-chain amino acid transport system ATP-binding protein